MGVRVLIEIDIGESSITTVGVVNTGYTTSEPELTVSLVIAQQLGIWPQLPKNTKEVEYKSAGGNIMLYTLGNCANVRLLVKEGLVIENCNILISRYEDEVLINDKLISALGIVIEDAGEGLWRLKGETEIRKSEQPELFL